MASDVRVRFAPSPTGKLHIGGARTAIYNWAFARANGGTFIRASTTPTPPVPPTRTRRSFCVPCVGWAWTGRRPRWAATIALRPDRAPGPVQAGRPEALGRGQGLSLLLHQGAARGRSQGRAGAQGPFQGYQRRCRDLDPEEARRRIEAGEPYVLRIKVPEDRGDVVIHDAVHGEVTFDAKELDDFVIFRSDGTPTYNFATVVDDAMMKITHVIRGDDHLSNTRVRSWSTNSSARPCPRSPTSP